MEFKNKPVAKLYGFSRYASPLEDLMTTSVHTKQSQKLQNSQKKLNYTHISNIPSFSGYTKTKINPEGIFTTDLSKIGQKMKAIENEIETDQKHLYKRITPLKRRKLDESTKNTMEEYKKLKERRLELIKKERIIKNMRSEVKVKPINPQRADYFQKYRRTSVDLYHGYNDESPPRGLKQVKEPYNSYKAIFIPGDPQENTHKVRRFEQHWRRSFDIISGINLI